MNFSHLLIKVIVFDFDGVITKRGEALKAEAWEILSADESGVFKDLLKEIRSKWSNGRGSRLDILKETLHGVGLTGQELDRKLLKLSSRYNVIVQDLVFKDGLSEESLSALKYLSKKFPLYINSATPEEAVRESCARLQIAKLFRGIFGQPQSKEENLKRIIHDEGVNVNSLLFIGDGEGDWRAAKEIGCHFIGMANDWNQWEGKEFPLIKSLTELPSLVTKSIDI